MHGPEDGAPMTFVAALRAAARGVGASVLAAGVAGLVDILFVGPEVRTTVVAIFGLLTLLLLQFSVRRELRGRAGAIASLAALGWLPAIFVAVWWTSQEPILSSYRVWKSPGLEREEAIAMALFVVVMLTGSALLATFARYPRLGRWIRASSVAALALGTVTTVALTRSGRPDANGYHASIPIVGTLDVNGSFLLEDGSKVTYRQSAVPPTPRRCFLEGIPDAFYYPKITTCEPLTIRHDTREHLWVLDHQEQWMADDSDARGLAFVFYQNERGMLNVHAAEVSDAIGPPITWTIAAILGLALGAVFFARGRRLEKRPMSEIQGTLQHDGWIVFPDGAPVRLPGTFVPQPGPIVLQLRRAVAGSSYRDMEGGIVESWRMGTTEQAEAERQASATSSYALALTSVLLCVAPLL